MFKNIDWKKMGVWVLNAILALIGGAGAGYVATTEAPEAYQTEYRADWDSEKPYRVTAAFTKSSWVKVGNFTDAEAPREAAGIGTVYISELSKESIVEAYEKLTGYTGVSLAKQIKTEKRPGRIEPIPVEEVVK